MDSLLTAAITVLLGAIAFSVGQFIVKAALEPAIELKRYIGKIAHDLDFYANQMYGDMPLGDEARAEFRRHACRLRENAQIMIWYGFFRSLLRLPTLKDLLLASAALIGHSNYPKQPLVGMDRTHDEEIKHLLRIRTK
jgi:hypothetical protein